MKKGFIISMALSLISFAVAIWFISTTEGQIPTNWGWDGEVNAWGSPWTILWFPCIAIFTTLLMYFLPAIDPKGENIKKSGPILPIIMVLIAALMIGIQGFMIAAVKGSEIMNMTVFISFALGIMFILMGYYMPRVKHNYMLGIRTPWTLFSEKVWNKTHEESARWIILAGILYLLGMFFPEPIGIIIPTIMVIVIFIGITWYSYLLYIQEKETKNTKK